MRTRYLGLATVSNVAMNSMPTAATVLKEFYDAVQRRDMKAARAHLADDMNFVGLFETYPNADAYIATFTLRGFVCSRLCLQPLCTLMAERGEQ
jgi:hypothetical protein